MKGKVKKGSSQRKDPTLSTTTPCHDREVVEKTAGLSIQQDPSPLKLAGKLQPGKYGSPVKLITNCYAIKTNEKVAFMYSLGSGQEKEADNKCGIQTKKILPGQPGQGDGAPAGHWTDIQAKVVRVVVFDAMRRTHPLFNEVKAVFDGIDSFYSIGQPLGITSNPMVCEFKSSLEEHPVMWFRVTFKPDIDQKTNRQKEINLQDDLDPEAIAVKQLYLYYKLSQQSNSITKG